MKLTGSQKAERLRKAADEVIEALLEWDEKNGRPSLTEIEDEVLALRQRLCQAMVGVMVGG